MTDSHHDRHAHSKAEFVHVLHRLGLPDQAVAEIAAQLSDPVDLDQVGALLQAYGLTRDAAISRMGGSP